jgi:NADPH:quinone reductase-like Zn-dependent oxidoreductase
MAQATAKIVRFHELGGAEVMKVEELPLPVPGKGEALLRVRAIGLNRAETSFRQGKYLVQPKLPSTLGYEAAGVVEAVGEGVDPALVGQTRSTVPAFPANEYGVYGEVALVPASSLAAYPEALSHEEGASIWMQYITAYGALIHFGKLMAGEFVLITAASSSVGIAAIELCKAEGAMSIATTRTQAKKTELLAAGADHVIVTEEQDLAKRVAEITGGKGARIVFDPVGGPGLKALAAAAAKEGLIVEYGGLSGEATPYPMFSAMTKHLTIRAYTLFQLTYDAAMRGEAVRYVYEKLAAGAFRPRIDKVFEGLDAMVEAHRYMESNAQIGKIVVKV